LKIHGGRGASSDGRTATVQGEAGFFREGVVGAAREVALVSGAVVLSEGSSGGGSGRSVNLLDHGGSLGTVHFEDFLVGFGVARDGGDEALIITILDADVTVLTPLGGPRVLDDPVGSGVFEVVANCQNAMINLRFCTVGNDTASVGLPSGSVDGDGERSNISKSSSHFGF